MRPTSGCGQACRRHPSGGITSCPRRSGRGRRILCAALIAGALCTLLDLDDLLRGYPGGAPCRADGLISVPTAGTGEPGSLGISAEYDGSSRLRSPDALLLLSTGYDLSERLSLGFDLLLAKGTRRTTVLSPNGSYLFLRGSHGLLGAGGFQNVGVRSFGEQPYVTFSQKVRQVGAHAGWTRDSGHDRLMLGLEGKLAPPWSAVADWITGSGNFAAFGLRYHYSDDRSLTVGYLHPNDPSQGAGLYLNYGFSWKVRAKQEGEGGLTRPRTKGVKG